MRRHNLIKQGSPLKTLGIGALGGLGVGALIDFLRNNKEREREKYRWWKRPLIYAALGSIPGLMHASSNYRNASINTDRLENAYGGLDPDLGLLDPLLLSNKELMNRSDVFRANVGRLVDEMRADMDYTKNHGRPTEKSLDDKMDKTASLYKRALGWAEPNIPEYAMINSLNTTTGIQPSTKSNMNNLFQAVGNATGTSPVSPAQVAGTLWNAGVGYTTGAIIGKTLGALCGISPQTYNTIKNNGMYAGMMNTMSNAITRY